MSENPGTGSRKFDPKKPWTHRCPVHPINERLEKIRWNHRMTIAEFHRQLGGDSFLSYQTVQGYLYDRTPSLEFVVKVSDTFGVPLRWIATGKEEA